MKKPLYIVLGFLLLLGIFSCDTIKKEKKIVIINLMQHPVLDSIQAQTKSYLLRNNYDKAHNYIIIEKNLLGQKELLSTVVNEVVSENPEIIIAITTPVAQAVIKKAKCPVVFSVVTDPVEAGIMDSINQTLPLITGTSDVFPYEKQIKLIKAIHPNSKNVGMVYDPGEAASRFALRELQKICPKYGLELIIKPVTSVVEIPIAARSLYGKADVIFVSSDNTVIAGVSALVSFCIKNKIPLYVGETGSVEKGGIATCSVSYGSFGEATGRLAAQLLSGKRNIPIYIPSEFETVINMKAASMMGVTIPENILSTANIVYTEIKK
ncbi:MAG: ABC transporter substrate-binding protein [Chitinophagaceae bacterium]|nr:ABC transporter substrate-binding protein [Chitinophagaceae bacterium]